jgi:ATP-dependent RNA helicase RhlE
MGELQAVEKLLKKPIPVLGGAPWSAEMVAAAPKPGQNRGQRPGRPGGQKPGSKPPAPGQRPASSKPGGQKPRQGGPKPQGGSFAPRRSDGGQKRRPG